MKKTVATTYKQGNITVEDGDSYYVYLKDNGSVIERVTIDKFQDLKDLFEILSAIVAENEPVK